MEVVIEIYGLEVFGYHGVLSGGARERGSRSSSTSGWSPTTPGCASDKLERHRRLHRGRRLRPGGLDDGQRFNLIEALAAAIADALLARFDVSRVRVRVRKPEVELDAPVEFTAATVERSRR